MEGGPESPAGERAGSHGPGSPGDQGPQGGPPTHGSALSAGSTRQDGSLHQDRAAQGNKIIIF